MPRSVESLRADMGSMAARIRSGQFGIMAVSLTRGDTLFAYNAGTPLLPASTMKMLTTARRPRPTRPDLPVQHRRALRRHARLRWHAARKCLPEGRRRSVTLRPVSPGRSRSADEYPGGSVCSERNQTYHRRSDRRPNGVDNKSIPEGWLTRYLQSGYAARVSALSLNENLVWVTIAPNGVRLEPATSAIPLISNVRTVAGGGARLSVRRFGDGSIQVSGTIGSRSPPRRYVYVVEDPARFTTGALRAALIAKGITVDGGIRLGPTPSTAVKIASIQSPTLDRIISAMNRESINHFAELLLRNAARGKDRSKQGTVANSKSLLREFFRGQGARRFRITAGCDGSGLSTLDALLPAEWCRCSGMRTKQIGVRGSMHHFRLRANRN
jgi:D-alanyl-D-alanine carboxypeptidase/D-alanyl-D-alanine-endopeptidase (penicillin-binding protein 4)